MLKAIYRILPHDIRHRAIGVVLTIFVRAILNFVGVAMLVPVLMMIIGGSIETNPYLSDVYYFLRFPADTFVVLMCAFVITVLVVKNILIQLLYRSERSYIFDIYRKLSRQLYIGYFQRGLGFIKRNNSVNLARDVNVVSLMFSVGLLGPMAQIAGDVLLISIILVVLAIYSPYVALCALLLFVPIFLLFHTLVRRRLREIGRRENVLQRAKTRIVTETYRGYADIKIGGAMPLMVNSFDDCMNEIIELRRRQASMSMLPQAFVEIGLVVGLASMVLWGNISNVDMQLMFGVFVAATLRLLPVVRNMMSAWSAIRYNRYTIDILKDIDMAKLTDIHAVTEKMEMHESLELRHVSFRFDDADVDTISDLSFEVKCGDCVGIRGRSGVGKSTLFNLILGLYHPTSGSILVDGVELNDANIDKWQNTIGYVAQDVFITDGTLLENITFGVDVNHVDYHLVNEVIELADLKSFVESLPEGLNSKIGEHGSCVSGGQRQRIGIARALYKKSNILLFDEATSSLDVDSERSINSAIQTLSKQCSGLTILIIAHRDSSLEHCNRIITLD